MRIDLLDAATLGDDLDLQIFSRWGELYIHQVSIEEDLEELLKKTKVVITNKLVFSKELMKKLPELKLICLTATGYDNIDVEGARELGIAVTNVAGYSTESVAQHTLALLLSLKEQIPWYDKYIKEGKYQHAPVFTNLSRPWQELKGKKWGIIGLGNIGRRVAELAEAFGCSVSYTSTSGVSRKEPWPQIDLNRLLKESHVVSVHAPLNDRTHNLLDYEQFQLMRDNSFFLNLGRGPIISEAGLCKSLEEGKPAGAALDVFSKEPISQKNPLMQINCPDRLILTPHTAWGSLEARNTLLQEISLNIEAFLSGTKRNRVV
ncbi:MAG: D-2-hydroxyacid dehydrogenase [Spirochaetaceae bacterium]|jgi:lactate dehydrogenase-like 2-hydroxyacid dehydrogenase|nr:D-2-hydroxyacid dehydrogenase [Spirochaetaceae bacterium]